jgi:3',5'-nucleoside bisphosphate phosphatase
MSFDLHTHSTASDGTEPPAHVVAEAARAGVAGLALTDHDSSAGWSEARAEALKQGLAFIPGMEVTSKTANVSVHMLSYLHDPEHPGMLEINAAARGGRMERAKRICDRLSEDFPVTWDLVLEHIRPGTSIGRPHLADALVAAGVVSTRSEAFNKYLHRGTKYFVDQDNPHPVDVVQRIRDAGGVPIIAHAMAGARGGTLTRAELEELVDAGLCGVEVYHRDNPEHGRQLLLDLATRHDLIITGSSDYHGARGKPNLLGENTTEAEQVVRILELGAGSPAIGPLPS